MDIKPESESNILRMVFDALPSLIFIVDEDVRIQDYNVAALGLIQSDRHAVILHRAGEILHCVHSSEVPEGCGRAPYCRHCVIRNSVTEAFQGKRVVRRRTRIELVRDGNRTEIYALITASPFTFQGRSLSLLVMEDISEIAELQRIIPICAVCKKIRNDTDAWMRLESFFKDNWDVNFSHGYCPECFKSEMAQMGGQETLKS